MITIALKVYTKQRGCNSLRLPVFYSRFIILEILKPRMLNYYRIIYWHGDVEGIGPGIIYWHGDVEGIGHGIISGIITESACRN
jgi:hypothetical protein